MNWSSTVAADLDRNCREILSELHALFAELLICDCFCKILHYTSAAFHLELVKNFRATRTCWTIQISFIHDDFTLSEPRPLHFSFSRYHYLCEIYSTPFTNNLITILLYSIACLVRRRPSSSSPISAIFSRKDLPPYSPSSPMYNVLSELAEQMMGSFGWKQTSLTLPL